MIGPMILSVVVFTMVYTILGRKEVSRGRAIWLNRQQIEKKYLKQWKPTSKESEMIITKNGISMKGGWRSRPKLRNRLGSKKFVFVVKLTVSLLFTGLIYLIFHIPVPIFFGIVNTWDNSDADSVYSVDANWSLGHKPATGEKIVIPDTSGIGKCTMDENSNSNLGSFTVQANGEFEAVTFTLDVNGDIILTGTFRRGTGTIQIGGGGVGNLTSGGNPLYHITVIDGSTIGYMKDNIATFDLRIRTNATFEIDAVSEASALTLTFDDATGAGIVNTSVGTLLCQGNGGNAVTMTSANAPPTNFWTWRTSGTSPYLTITADFATFRYYNIDSARKNNISINNCTFDNAETHGFDLRVLIGSLSSFTNNTISNAGSNGLELDVAYAAFDNIVITSPGGSDIEIIGDRVLEFTNSNFDMTNINFVGNTGCILSDTHNDVANAWFIAIGSGSTCNKSTITNDFTSSDNVTIQTGTLTVDEATAHNNLTMKSGGTFDVSPNITQTITNTGTITVESGGTLEWTGSSGSIITLVSDSPGTQWSLANSGTVNVAFVNVQDSDASGGSAIDASDGSSANSGNNDNWTFLRLGSQGTRSLPFWVRG